MGVKQQESQMALLIIVFVFILGMVITLMTAVPLALFLVEYDASWIPYVYIFAGLSNVVVGYLFELSQKKISLFKSLSGSLILLAVSLFLFWGLLVAIESKWVAFGLAVWSICVVKLGTFVYEALFPHLFTLQQGKRLFGLFNSANALGGIVGGFSLPFLVKIMDLPSVVLLSSFCLFISLFFQRTIHKKYGKKLLEPIQEETERKTINYRNVQEKKYIFLILLFSVFLVFDYYIIDMFFNVEAKKNFPGSESLASFLGIFLGVCEAVSLIIGAFAVRGILRKFGVVFSVLLTPISIAVIAIGVIFLEIGDYSSAMIFGLIVLAKFLNEVLHSTINPQAALLFYQPLPSSVRTWLQVKSEFLIAPLAFLCVAFILIVFDKFVGIDVLHFSSLILLVSLLGIVVLICLRKEYFKTLIKECARKGSIIPSFIKLDKKGIHQIKNQLNSKKEEDVAYAFCLLDKVDSVEFQAQLLQKLNHSSPDIRCYLFSKIEEYRIIEASVILKRLLPFETLDFVIRQGALALAACQEFKFLQDCRSSSNTTLGAYSVIALEKYGPSNIKKETSEWLAQKSHSSEKKDQELAAIVFTKKIVLEKSNLITRLMKGSDILVKLEELIFSNNEGFFKYLSDQFPLLAEENQLMVLNVLGSISHKNIIPFLLQHINHSNLRISYGSMWALKQQKYRASKNSDIDLMHMLLDSENDRIVHLEKLFHPLRAGVFYHQTTLLREFVSREIELSQKRILLLLNFIYPEKEILTIMDAFITGKEDLVSYSVEVLLFVLNATDKKIIPILEVCTRDAFEEESENVVENLKESLFYFLYEGSHFYLAEIPTVAVYVMGLLPKEQFREELLKVPSLKSPYFSETLTWAIR